MPRDTIVSTDVGSHKMLVGQGWTTYAPRALLMTNGLSSMGFSLPAAIAAKLVHPDRPVVCFVGDGGLAMVQGELRVAASLKIDPIVVVFCDNSLNRIELKQMARQYPSWGTVIEPTDIALLARAMGCDGVEVDSARALESVLAGARAKDRPLVIGAKSIRRNTRRSFENQRSWIKVAPQACLFFSRTLISKRMCFLSVWK